MKRIAWVGFGWLAQNIAKQLPKNEIESIYFSRTLKTTELKGYVFDLLEPSCLDKYLKQFKELSHLVFTVPPSISNDYVDYAVSFMNHICDVNQQLKIIVCSSISIYGMQEGLLNEKSIVKPESSNALKLVALENEMSHLSVTFLRLGGLVGPGRHPIYHLSGKQNLKGKFHPINLIHSDEVVAFINLWIKNDWHHRTINLVNPSTMTKSAFYESIANRHQLKLPIFSEDSTVGKKVTSLNLKALNFDKNFIEPLDYIF